MRDRVRSEQLGVASSIKVFLDLTSLVAAALISGRLMSSGAGPQAATFLVIIGLLLGTAGVTLLFTHEEPSGIQRQHDEIPIRSTEYSGAILRSGYWWLIAERAAFLLGVYGLQAFGQYYLQDALHLPNPARTAGNLLSIIGAGTIVFVVAAGWLADRVGAKRLLYVGSGLAAAGMLAMLAAADLPGLYGAGSLVGAGMGLFLTSNWALANQMAPTEHAGRHLGLTNVATAGSAALVRLGGPAVDWLNAVEPGVWWGYHGIFLFGAACILVSTWCLSKVGEKVV